MKLFITPGGHKLTNKKFTIKIRTGRRYAVEVARRTRRRRNSHPAAFSRSSLRIRIIARDRDNATNDHSNARLWALDNMFACTTFPPPLREENEKPRKRKRHTVAAVVVVITSCVTHVYTSTHNPTIRLKRTGAATISGVGIYNIYCCGDILKLEIKRSQRIYTDECSLETRCVLKSNSMKQTIWGLR